MWYGSEVIAHHDTLMQGEVDLNTCVTIHLRDVTHEVRQFNLIYSNINRFLILSDSKYYFMDVILHQHQ